MKKVFLGGMLALLVAALVVTVAPAHNRSGKSGFKAFISGYAEVPSISTTGVGKFKARLNGDTIEYSLKYSDLEGGAVSAAHIHLGQRGVNGGVVAFLCGGGGKPACPAGDGDITGTIVAADVQALAAQGIAAGEFDELVAAMKHGVTYVNIHTATFGSGEIRGQIGGGKGHFRFKSRGFDGGGDHGSNKSRGHGKH